MPKQYTKPWIVVNPQKALPGERPPHCTKAHAAREIGISRSRVGQLVKEGELLTITLNGHEYILSTSLDRYLIQARII